MEVFDDLDGFRGMSDDDIKGLPSVVVPFGSASSVPSPDFFSAQILNTPISSDSSRVLTFLFVSTSLHVEVSKKTVDMDQRSRSLKVRFIQWTLYLFQSDNKIDIIHSIRIPALIPYVLNYQT